MVTQKRFHLAVTKMYTYRSVVITHVQEFVSTYVVVCNDIYGILTLSSMKRGRRGSEEGAVMRDTTFLTTT
jgi:hypothetical protein